MQPKSKNVSLALHAFDASLRIPNLGNDTKMQCVCVCAYALGLAAYIALIFMEFILWLNCTNCRAHSKIQDSSSSLNLI